MPIYEFECSSCGSRFETLASAGTDLAACRDCGAAEARRVYSALGPPLQLVKTPTGTRKQERKNTQLRQAAKRRFKQARQRARQRRGGGG